MVSSSGVGRSPQLTLLCFLALALGPGLAVAEEQAAATAGARGGRGMESFAPGDPRNCLQDNPDLRIMQVSQAGFFGIIMSF